LDEKPGSGLRGNQHKALSRIFLEEWFQRFSAFQVQHDKVVRMHSPVFRGLSVMPVTVTSR